MQKFINLKFFMRGKDGFFTSEYYPVNVDKIITIGSAAPPIADLDMFKEFDLNFEKLDLSSKLSPVLYLEPEYYHELAKIVIDGNPNVRFIRSEECDKAGITCYVVASCDYMTFMSLTTQHIRCL